MSKKNSNFAPVNDKQLITVLNAKIAQLTVALDEAERNGSSAQLQQFEQLLSRQKEEDRAYYEQRMDDERIRHRQELEEERARHRQEMESLKADFRFQIGGLHERIDVLQKIATARELSASEMKALARFRQQEKYKRSSEQQRLLNRRTHTEDREKEKDDFDGTAGTPSLEDTSATPSTSGETTGTGESAPQKAKDKKKIKPREDCRKNTPYTSDPAYMKLQDYFTLPFGGKFVMRDGEVDVWQMRELVRIPEHYEERFYEVARYRTADGELHSTRSRQIPGCCLDDNLIGYVLGEHFVYNKPYRQISLQLKSLGLNMGDSTLGRQVHKVIKYFRGKMQSAWEQVLETADYWMVDETPGLVGCIKDGIKSYFKRYFWGIKAKVLKLVWFLYENGSRGLNAIKPFLDKFVGFFTTDGYVVYKAYDGESTPNQTRIACLTHIRRNFVNSLEENRPLSMWFIDEFGRLFGNEYEFKKKRYSAEQILKERNSDNPSSTKAIMARIRERLESFKQNGYAGCGQLMKKALTYALNEWDAMEKVLQSGVAELSNNLAEQMMRHLKLNLKTSMNIGSEDAACDNAFMYSLIESCHMNTLSPVKYIEYLMSALRSDPTDTTSLLPCYCKLETAK